MLNTCIEVFQKLTNLCTLAFSLHIRNMYLSRLFNVFLGFVVFSIFKLINVNKLVAKLFHLKYFFVDDNFTEVQSYHLFSIMVLAVQCQISGFQDMVFNYLSSQGRFG